LQRLTDQGQQKINELAQRYGVSTDAVMTLLQALVTSNGTMAQFNHRERGGGGQWMLGGATCSIMASSRRSMGSVPNCRNSWPNNPSCRSLRASSRRDRGAVNAPSMTNLSRPHQELSRQGAERRSNLRTKLGCVTKCCESVAGETRQSGLLISARGCRLLRRCYEPDASRRGGTEIRRQPLRLTTGPCFLCELPHTAQRALGSAPAATKAVPPR
jgi:hypothetical protein